jgi:hypothetical protein
MRPKHIPKPSMQVVPKTPQLHAPRSGSTNHPNSVKSNASRLLAGTPQSPSTGVRQALSLEPPVGAEEFPSLPHHGR